MTKYSKPSLSVDDQIALLTQRGLIIKNPDFAKHTLSNISYYRLSSYFYNFWEDKTNHNFYKNITFEEVVNTYNFDKELRAICFKAIETIEISIRTKLSLFLSPKYGAYWFCNENIVHDKISFSKITSEINDLSKQKNEQFIKEHFSKYSDEYLPSWKLLEITSFGLLSRMYGNIKNSAGEKKAIAKSLAVPNHIFLVSWLKSISAIRNICAHHSRLWDKTLSTPVAIPDKIINAPWISAKMAVSVKNNKLFIALCCIRYLLNNIQPNNQFAEDISRIIKKYPNIDLEKMNFPQDWQKESLWVTK